MDSQSACGGVRAACFLFPIEHALLVTIVLLLLAVALGIPRVGDLLADRFSR
jgi:hypothetical protein